MLRRIVLREMKALQEGRPLKQWRRLEHNEDLPIQGPAAARA